MEGIKGIKEVKSDFYAQPRRYNGISGAHWMLSVRDVYKTYEGKPLLRGVSFDLSAGETLCLLGPSGSGKSTLLRIIAGLETAERGQVTWDGQDLAGVATHRRNFGLMFQDYALFPHRNVIENVAFGLRMQGLSREETQTRAMEALEGVNLAEFASRRVTDLSGGEQQRVALARALAPRPRLLMLDEPLGALDRGLKDQLLNELRRLLHSTGIPAIYVTHDQEEAFALADRLLLLHEGSIVQSGSPDDVYTHPGSAWVAAFLGQTNLIPGEVIGGEPLMVKTEVGVFRATSAAGQALRTGEPVTLLLRADEAHLLDYPSDRAGLCGRVSDVVFKGDGYQMDLQVEEQTGGGIHELSFRVSRLLTVGAKVALEIPAEAAIAFRGGEDWKL
jgi:ABC-type Fe3+/spermidine/putrescine transport system ATPase subunit